MRHLSICLLAAIAIGPATLRAQAPARTATEIAHMFTKQKHVVKEKRGIRAEKFADVRSEPALLRDVRDYAGEYRADFGFTLRLSVSGDGAITGAGGEPGRDGTVRRFELMDAEISEGLLRATKAYDDGDRERFAGAFLQRTDRRSPNGEATRMFGLGVPDQDIRVDGMEVNKLFYQRQ